MPSTHSATPPPPPLAEPRRPPASAAARIKPRSSAGSLRAAETAAATRAKDELRAECVTLRHALKQSELALKTAILAARNADKIPDGKRWFLETCLTLIDKAGDLVSDAMWHRVCLLYTSPSPRDGLLARMESSA